MKLVARGLSHGFDGRRVLNDLSLSLERGEIVGLLGPNGAGKSTAIGLMAGQIPLKCGEVHLGETRLNGLALWERVRLGLGYLPQQSAVIRNCSVRENLLVAAKVSGMSMADVDVQLDQAGLAAVADSRAGTLSGGERRRLEIARCMVTSPHVLLMDEPFAGIDPVGIEGLQATVRSLAKSGLAVLITDHAVAATLRVCDRAIILDNGSVMATGCPEEIVQNDAVRDRYLGAGFNF